MSRENVEALRRIDGEWRKGNLRAGIEFYDPWILFIPHPDFPDAAPRLGIESVKT